MKDPWKALVTAPAAVRDLAVIAISTVIFYLISARFNFTEELLIAMKEYEQFQFDEVLLVCVFLVAALSVFSWRRLREERQKNAELVVSEQERARISRQLQLMTTITRHDVLNKLTVVRGSLRLLRRKITDPVAIGLAEKMETPLEEIQAGIEFTRVYQNIGLAAPQWQELCEVVRACMVPAGLCLDTELPPFEIHADAMLSKVFANLMENSVSHGEHATRIRIAAHADDGTLVIVYEDNGAGIPSGLKERIFEHGYGRHTGLGLFLSREILAITGIAITENGEPGKGVRFVMTVPAGGFRPVPSSGGKERRENLPVPM